MHVGLEMRWSGSARDDSGGGLVGITRGILRR